jgi:xanthosine utilization system XapX-like protein
MLMGGLGWPQGGWPEPVWRAVLGALAAGMLAGVVIGILTTALGMDDPSALSGVVSLLGMAIGVGVSAEVMYRVLKKKFKGFAIALVRTP